MFKKILLIVVILSSFLFFDIIELNSATLTKIWNYGHSTRKGWVPQYQDEWGGMNYWCTGSGNECGYWDWKAVYHLPNYYNPTPANTCNSQYGDNLVRQAASYQGYVLPGNLGLPSYQESWY